MRATMLMLVLLTLGGCGAKKVEIQSNVCWSGKVGSSSVEGCGNQTFTLHGDPKCAVIYCKGGQGVPDSLAYVRARIKGEAWHQAAIYDSVYVCQ